VIAITVPPSLAVTVCGVLICCLCGFFAGIVPTMAEAGPAMRFALELSYGRWATQCLASSDFLNIPNALYAEQGRMLVAMFAWPSPADLAKNGAGPCSKPFGVLITLGVVLRIVGCLAINFCHRGHQCKPPLCMPAFKAPRGRRPVVKNLQRSRVSRKPLLLGTAASRVASSAMV
jgi:invasion protein IalB